MPHTYYPAGNPKFNHVALSVPSDLLDEANRADLCRYFDEVLGFEEMPTMTIDRKRLILSCVHWDQFIFLVANDEPMRCPPDRPLRVRRRLTRGPAGGTRPGRGVPGA